MTLVGKIFSQDDQIAFAQYSGDWNPIHLDAIAARRTQIGQPIVHGMHIVLWALNEFAREFGNSAQFQTVNVAFRKPIYVHEVVEISIVQNSASTAKINVCAEGVALASISLDATTAVATSEFIGPQPECAKADSIMPKILEFAQMAGRSGYVRIPNSGAAFEDRYRNAVSWLGTRRVRAIAALSRVVGMECPGLHSLFMSVKVQIANNNEYDDLFFAVQDVDARFQLVQMAVRGGGIDGLVTARFRAEAIDQPTLATIAQHVSANEFAAQTPLIIGGSRGLGELTAKIYAAGGATPIITYCVGEADAKRVAQDISAWGGDCSILKYDATLPPQGQLDQLSASPQQVYYFATGIISRRKRNIFEQPLFEEFFLKYVTGFYDLCRALRNSCSHSLCVFYPSTSYIDHRPRDMTEYVMAKLAGEALCEDLRRHHRGLNILVRRLPPLITDQTAALPAAGSGLKAIEILSSIAREMGQMSCAQRINKT